MTASQDSPTMPEHHTLCAAAVTGATAPPRNRLLLLAIIAGALSLAAACTTPPPAPEEARPSTRVTTQRGTPGLSPALAEAAARIQTESTPVDIAERERARIYKGTGVVVKGQAPGGGLPPGQGVQPAGGGVVLNFEGADLREVVRNVLGDILAESYTIDPAVGGQVTIRTSAGIPREALPATLEMLLRMNGATMIREAGLFKIVPSAVAVRGNVTPQLGTSNRALPSGYSVQIVPLRFVGVREMLKILEPFAKDAQAVRADDLRNLIILAGTELEVRHLMQTIEMFDIDWMAGMSAGVFTLQNADVKSVMAEFEKLVGTPQTSPFGGILRVVPIERMNALLVVTPNPQYLEEAKKWIERLDRGGIGDGPRLYVYHMQNSRAEKVAPLLQQAFTGRAPPQTGPAQPSIQPGTPPGTIVSPPAFQPQPSGVVPPPPPAQVTITPPTAAAVAGQQGTGIVRNLQAVADKDNNTIIVVATPVEYFVIENALKRLDTPQRQVAIEVTIAEVVLNDNLQFGVDFLFRDAAPSGRGFGGNVNAPILSTTGGAADAISGALRRGFSYLISNAAFPGGIQAALRLLDTYGNTKVIANPHLSALDNQKATIKVGDKIPICQQTLVGGTVNTNVTTTSQYIDTGVLVQVTPHINAGGLVTLDVQAEVSNPGAPANADPCTAPPIATRSVQTLLAVPSGRTMVMGGLIGERKILSSAGLPLLSRIPIIGGLFGEQSYQTGRTELILFITPRVVESESDVRAIIDDLRRKMERLDEVFPGKRDEPVMTPR